METGNVWTGSGSCYPRFLSLVSFIPFFFFTFSSLSLSLSLSLLLVFSSHIFCFKRKRMRDFYSIYVLEHISCHSIDITCCYLDASFVSLSLSISFSLYHSLSLRNSSHSLSFSQSRFFTLKMKGEKSLQNSHNVVPDSHNVVPDSSNVVPDAHSLCIRFLSRYFSLTRTEARRIF